MCGFTCLWNVGNQSLADSRIRKIAHRGPDALQVSQLP
jgi:asparagine synthase (glutamine-hydrolysing)